MAHRDAHGAAGRRPTRVRVDAQRARVGARGPATRGRSWSPWEVAGLSLTTVPVAVVVGRLLLFTEFDLDLIRLVARGLDFGAVAVSVFTPTLALLPALGFTLAVWPVRRWRPLFRVALAASSIAAAALLPLLWVGLSALAISGVWQSRRIAVELGRADRRSSALATLLPVVAAALLFNLSTGFWLPAEAIDKADGSRVVGYVVEAGDHDLTVIEQTAKRPEILRQDSVVKRTLCSTRDRENAVARVALTPVHRLLAHRRADTPRLPRC